MSVPNVSPHFISLHKESAFSLSTANRGINGQNKAVSFLMDLLIKIALPLTVKANAANANLHTT
jgi:hypothetical protein